MKLFNNILLAIAWGFVALLGFGMLTSFVLLVLALQKGMSDVELEPLRVKGEHAVGVVDLSGEILGSDKFRRELTRLVDNKKIKAIVVRIDSPGGSVGAAEEIYRSIKLAAEKKPVVCSLGNVAASGGLYAAVACQKVVTNLGTLTGSIGVIMMMPNFRTITDNIGMQMNVIKSGKFKDTGSPFRDLSPEDREFLQSLVNQTYEQFVRVIAEGRSLEADKVKEFADGRIILGEQAVDYGLADEVGGLARAAKLALELTGETEKEPQIILPKRARGVMALFEDVQESRLYNWLWDSGRARLLYQAYL